MTKEKKEIQFDFNDREEVNHRFSGNTLAYLKDGVRYPFNLERARNGSFEGQLFEGTRYAHKMLEVTHDAFDWSFPELGYVNIDNISIYFQRSPGKHYKRGYSAKLVTIDNAFKQELYSLGVRKRYTDASSGKMLFSLFNREFDDFHTAVNSIEDGSYLARAFDKDWCVGIKQYSAKPIIMYKNRVVGFFSDGQIKLIPDFKFLIETLQAHAEVSILDNFQEVYK